jgi:hypothetical protein
MRPLLNNIFAVGKHMWRCHTFLFQYWICLDKYITVKPILDEDLSTMYNDLLFHTANYLKYCQNSSPSRITNEFDIDVFYSKNENDAKVWIKNRNVIHLWSIMKIYMMVTLEIHWLHFKRCEIKHDNKSHLFKNLTFHLLNLNECLLCFQLYFVMCHSFQLLLLIPFKNDILIEN